MKRRVVITGVGPISGLGVGKDALWQGLVAGASCLRPIEAFDPSGLSTSFGGELQGLNIRDWVPKSYRKAAKVMARDIQLAVAAAQNAVTDAGLVTEGSNAVAGTSEPLSYPKERLGCTIGAGLIAAELDELSIALSTAVGEDGQFSYEAWGQSGMDNLTPLWMLKTLPNMLACHVTIIHQCKGVSNTITCAEASGLLSIGESARVIERGDADACLSGSAESKLNPMGMVRMDYAGRVANAPDATDPQQVQRPYVQGSGGIIGEGGAMLLLEEAEAASSRGATPYAEIVGFGRGHAPLLEREDADETYKSLGMRAAIQSALRDAGIKPEDVSVIVPTAAGAPHPDSIELPALRDVFGEGLEGTPIITHTPNVGNTVAGMGGLQAAIAAIALKEQHLPARVHAGGSPADVPVGQAQSKPASLGYALCCTVGVGGPCAAVVLKAV